MKIRMPAVTALLTIALCTITIAPARAQSPAQVSPDQFAALEWLEGRWIGSGGGSGEFYEEYRFLDDGTIEQTTWSDSSFSTRESRSTIRYRGGMVMKGPDGQVESLVTRMKDDGIRFEWADADRPGYTWTRISDDEWVAVLDRAGQAPLVYNMRRMRTGG